MPSPRTPDLMVARDSDLMVADIFAHAAFARFRDVVGPWVLRRKFIRQVDDALAEFAEGEE